MSKTKYKQGIFKPQNEDKYIGNKNNIVYRSSIELRYMRFFDKHDKILKWNSEEIIIPYPFKIDNKIHRYFPDFYIEYINSKKEIEKAIIEIKSSSEYVETIVLYLKKLNIENKDLMINKIKDSMNIELTEELIEKFKNYKQPQKITQQYKEHIIYCFRNIYKWEAAKKFCKDKGLKFIILTELDLNYLNY